ncbi:hypothetical protein Pmani_011898 [Petrolisthes manimaculis]|uniref:G patch domain-containing protein 4 n=1 Tax=Petrolisthes manimaculis TaxID=1843537 RepID=A0AAE1UB14_9EUCA|nr:hypothetical protein Pmani_011898 [Petrolisthes manimaculis]
MSQGKGMDFARRMMEKCGWSEGKGLGRDEGGITEAIRPKLKFDTAGLNYNKADEFNFHWWDHVFNKAAHNITVHKNQDDVVHISRSRELEVSTKRPSKKHARDHSGFIKGKTLIGQCGEVAGLVECSDDDEEEEKDRSLKLTDEQLFQMCEGRTAHKGARHGLNMTAKLARVKEQDRKLMEAWNKSADNLVKEEKIYSEENLVKKKKKKKRSVDNDLDQMPQETVEDNDEKILVTQEEMPGREKKSKKRHQQEKEEETEATNTEDSIKIKKKKKKKRNRETDDIKEESIGPGGCDTKEGFYFAGQTWYARGCRRRKCIHFRGTFFTETDSCDTEIFNTTYRCVVQVDTTAQYPACCPTYKCNPDNLGNAVK